jgi:hypothetical protein
MARKAEKVAVSLDRELLAHAERLRKSTGESRSALVGRALRQLLRSEARSARVAEYVEAYRRMPESAQDVRRARTVARRSLGTLPWDDQ